MRVIDFSGALLDQTYVVQVWALSNALFVWMGAGVGKPALRCVCRVLANTSCLTESVRSYHSPHVYASWTD
jgi:hypothetical protein